jgi:Alpha/beta hydrolase domain
VCVSVLAVASLAAAGTARGPVAQIATLVPNPVVIGPIPATASPGDPSHDYPFFSTTIDLVSHGYIEEEFFFEGTATSYNIPAPLTLVNTPMTTADVVASGLPFRTRMVVRRPVSQDGFNGTVLMEWQNVATGYDFDAGWLVSHEHILRRGYAWVGVSAQQAGVHQPATGLQAWSPTRYWMLDLTAGGTILNDSLQYDVFSQAAQAVRDPVGTDPMAGLNVERIIAVGASLSAVRLVAYHNAVHPLAGVFDGFMPFLNGARLRTDLGAKVFKVLSETDVANTQIPFRQTDSNDLRRWEVAGTSHVDFRLVQQVIPLQTRDFGGPLQPTNCTSPPYSRIPLTFVIDAALDHMVAWVKHGKAPPHGSDIETVGMPPVIARDPFGNALGGIRLSQHAVPTATNTGLNTPLTNFCRTFGTHLPFDEQTLATLYPDHQSYLAAVIEATHETQRDGFIVGADAAATIRDAARSNIGRR